MSQRSGPTQGAELRDSPDDAWQSRRLLALVLRAAIFITPVLGGVGFSWLMGRVLPPQRLGIGKWTWLVVVVVAASVLATLLQRLLGRILPLVALMKLSLVFPDQAPSRARNALRQSNGRKLLRELEASGPGAVTNGDMLAQLLMAINKHDRLTRGHSERVRAYSELIAEEIGLSKDDMHKLRWGALLHDVGKLTVPEQILNKNGRPTDDEWQILQGHPGAGGAILEPLRPWLGDWLHAADQHHCRWDGDGYPTALAGHDITLAGRIVAVADAYDVMTSARSYKKALSHDVARQELTECAGAQFDPEIVRAFLNVSVGRLRAAAGPLSWVANTASSGELPISLAWTTVSSGATVAATAVVVTVGGTGTPPIPDEDADQAIPELLALDSEELLELGAVSGVGREDELIEFRLTATGGRGAVTIVAGEAQHGDLVPGTTQGAAATSDEASVWVQPVSFFPDHDFHGADEFTFEACDEGGQCAVALANITIEPINDPPRLQPDRAAVKAATLVAVAVLENDDDPEDQELTIDSVTEAQFGEVRLVGANIEYKSIEGFVGIEELQYTVVDSEGSSSTMGLVIEVFADEPPAITTPTPAPRPSPRPQRPTATPAPIPTTAPTPGPSPTPAPTSTPGVSPTPTPTPTPAATGTPAPTPTPTAAPPPNQLPVAMGDSGAGFTGSEDSTLNTSSITANDSDPDHPVDPTSINIVTNPTKGAATSNPDGTITYTPALHTNGVDTLSYTITDPDGAISNTATVAISIAAVNDPPETTADTLTVTRGFTATTVDLRLNDSDPDGHAFSVIAVSAGANGTTVLNGNSSVTYAHDGTPTTTDTFTYTIEDTTGMQAFGSVAVTITAIEDYDGIASGSDNCPFVFNIDQFDTDGDGIGDACDPVSTSTSGATFTQAPLDLGSGATVDVAVADIDGDGDLDVVFAQDGEANTVWRNVLFGLLTNTGQDLGTDRSRAVALGDVDGDGDVDAVFGNTADEGNTVWTNDGSGSFADSLQSLGSSSTQDVALGDFDGDGDLDVATANQGQDNLVWTNDGAGAFIDTGQALGSGPTKGVATADLDGDGDLDLAFANDNSPDTVWLNDGTGIFTNTGQTLDPGRSHEIAFADLDGDGDLDMAVAGDNDPDTIWFNDGTGTFANTGQTLGLSHSRDLALGDLDGDGDIDIAYGNHTGANSIWLNDGTGTFTDSGQMLDTNTTEGIALGDIDGDGDLGLVTANQGDPNRTYTNS